MLASSWVEKVGLAGCHPRAVTCPQGAWEPPDCHQVCKLWEGDQTQRFPQASGELETQKEPPAVTGQVRASSMAKTPRARVLFICSLVSTVDLGSIYIFSLRPGLLRDSDHPHWPTSPWALAQVGPPCLGYPIHLHPACLHSLSAFSPRVCRECPIL